MLSAICFNLDQCNILPSGNGLKGKLTFQGTKHGMSSLQNTAL